MAKPKKRSKTKKILFAVEIIVLLVFIGGLYVYGQLMSRMDKTNTQKLDTQKVQVNEEVQDAINSEDAHLTGYTTYALFGIDSRSAFGRALQCRHFGCNGRFRRHDDPGCSVGIKTWNDQKSGDENLRFLFFSLKNFTHYW